MTKEMAHLNGTRPHLTIFRPIALLLLLASWLTGSAQANSMLLVEQLQAADPVSTVLRVSLEDTDLGALFRSTQRREPFGNVLLLHDSGQHPDWPGPIHHLRHDLSLRGWQTISLNVPPLPPQAARFAAQALPPKQPLTADNPFSQMMLATLELMLGQSPLPVLVVAAGSSATLAAETLAFWARPEIAGLVMLDPAPVVVTADQILFPLAQRYPLPVLDLVPADHSRSDPGLRKTYYPAFQQTTLPGASAAFAKDGPRIARKVHAWGKQLIKAND